MQQPKFPVCEILEIQLKLYLAIKAKAHTFSTEVIRRIPHVCLHKTDSAVSPQRIGVFYEDERPQLIELCIEVCKSQIELEGLGQTKQETVGIITDTFEMFIGDRIHRENVVFLKKQKREDRKKESDST
jgi:hypothetical protein